MSDALSRALAGGDATEVVAALVADSSLLLRRGDLSALRAAADVVAPSGGPLPVAVAWRLGFALHQGGHFDEALATYERAVIDGHPPPPQADVAQLLASHASTRWARGDAVGSRALADRALAEATASADDSALASAWVAQALVCALEGDRNTNLHAYEKALAAARRAGDLLTQVRVLNNLGSLETEEGRYAAALVHLDDAVTVAEAEISTPIRALTLINRAEALLGLGRVDEALAELTHAGRLAREQGSPLLAYAALGVGDVNRVRGNATQAAVSYREAVTLAERTGDAQVLGAALAGLARAGIVEDPEEARVAAARALAEPAAMGTVEPLLAAGWLALHDGDAARAAELGRSAAREAGRRRDSRGLAEALELRALADPGTASARDLLEEAGTLWAATGHAIGRATNRVLAARARGDAVAEQAARGTLRSLGVRDDAHRIAGPLQALGAHAGASVVLRALGAFTVLRDGVPVPASAWQSRKSRDALKLLAGRGGRPITREALSEHLWPGTPGTGSRLSVVLSTVRAVLDPEKRHGADHYLLADRATVALARPTVEVDVDLFVAAAREALEEARGAEPGAVEALERAAALYTGHYLEDDPYSEWAEERREELLALVQEVRRTLAQTLLRGDQPQRAVGWLVSALADDPYDEPTHHGLLRALHRGGRYGEARRHHRAYAVRMEEIGVPAAPLQAVTG